MNSIILSKLWYHAQIYPPNNSNIAEIRTICRNFIFKGIGLYRVRFNQLYLVIEKGGLSLIDVEIKAKSLFMKNILFVHQDEDKDSFMLSQQNNRSLSRNSLNWIRETNNFRLFRFKFKQKHISIFNQPRKNYTKNRTRISRFAMECVLAKLEQKFHLFGHESFAVRFIQ